MNSKELIELINDAGYEARSYSGRGMCGAECVGVSCDSETNLIVDIMCALTDTDSSVTSDVIRAIRNTSVDSLGMGIIVYWPRMKWVE